MALSAYFPHSTCNSLTYDIDSDKFDKSETPMIKYYA